MHETFTKKSKSCSLAGSFFPALKYLGLLGFVFFFFPLSLVKVSKKELVLGMKENGRRLRLQR